MNNKKNRKASSPMLRGKDSIVAVDPKGELSAVMARWAKKKAAGVMTVNPFVVLPPQQAEKCGKFFRGRRGGTRPFSTKGR